MITYETAPVTDATIAGWRSRAAMTQVRSTQTATAQDIGPCWAAVPRMWVGSPGVSGQGDHDRDEGSRAAPVLEDVGAAVIV